MGDGELTEFRVQQIIDNGRAVQMTVVENLATEPVSQKQMIMESVAKRLDEDTRKHVTPLLEAILQAQPTINVKSYQQTTITISMPKGRYERMGKPEVGSVIDIRMGSP